MPLDKNAPEPHVDYIGDHMPSISYSPPNIWVCPTGWHTDTKNGEPASWENFETPLPKPKCIANEPTGSESRGSLMAVK
jgi:hypothetical protein